MSKYIYDDVTKEIKELILCKYCRYYRSMKYLTWDICELSDKAMKEEDYCSKAERNDYENKKRNF